MARMKKRDDGRYQRQVSVGKNADGTLIRRTVYAKTQKELDEKTELVKQGVECGGQILSTTTTFGDLAALWMASYGKMQSEKWIYRQRTLIDKHLLPKLGAMKVMDLKQFHLQILINEKAAEGLATGTMRQIKQTAARILEVAFEADMIRRNFFDTVKVPKKDPTERQALTEDQIKMVNETWETHCMGYPAMIMLYCGLRKGELLALRWKDVDLEKDIISVNKSVTIVTNQPTIKTPKSKAGVRQVPIPTILHNVLIQVKGADNEVVCPGCSGQVMSDSAYSSAWHSYMNHLNLFYGGSNASRTKQKIIAIQPFTAHMLRHTYATLLYDAGVDIKTAQRYLGHANVELTLSVYTHLTKYKEGKAMDAFNKMVDEKKLQEQAGVHANETASE